MPRAAAAAATEQPSFSPAALDAECFCDHEAVLWDVAHGEQDNNDHLALMSYQVVIALLKRDHVSLVPHSISGASVVGSFTHSGARSHCIRDIRCTHLHFACIMQVS